MSSNFESALFSLTGSVEAVRETMVNLNFGKPLTQKSTGNELIINLEKESDDVISILKETNTIYMNKLNSTNELVSQLMKDLEHVQNELIIERQHTMELKAQLDALKRSI